MIKYFSILLFIFTSSLYSEGGSNYSSFGIGDLETVQGAAYWGAAGTAIAVPSTHAINLVNPAMWAFNELTRIQLGYKFQQNYIDSKENSLYQNFGAIDGLNIMFAIDTSLGLSAGFGLNAFSQVNYSIASGFSKTVDDLQVSGKLENSGGGGIKKIYFGASIKPLSFLALGITQNVYLGNIQRDALTFSNESYAHNSYTGRKNSFNGTNQKIGLNFIYKDLSIGAYYENAANLRMNSELIFLSYYDLEGTGSSIVDTSFKENSKIEIPSSLGFGLSYKLNKFRISSDFYTQDFSDFTYNQSTNSTFNSLNSFTLGVERLGNKSSGAKGLDKFTYRFGAGYKDLYMQVNNIPITEQYLSLGFSAPFGKNSMFDFAFVLGTRGEINSPLVKEYFGRMYFNLSIGEQWFVPFKREFED